MIANSMLDSVRMKHNPSYISCYVEKYGLALPSNKMLEVGGSGISPKGTFQRVESKKKFWFGMDYYNLDLMDDKQHNTIIGDICNAPFEDNIFDFIYSIDTLEHIFDVQKACKEITRILKPGGILGVITLFSWRYHPSGYGDYWRFSPICLAKLFEPLQCLEANWDNRNRWQPMQGVTREDKVPVEVNHNDGFKENWRVYYIGLKNENKRFN